MNPLLQDAAEWRLLSLLFECPNAGWRDQVATLGKEVADPALRKAARQALDEAGEGLHHSIFGPGGPAPAREASYAETVQLGYLMSDLTGYYEAFAYQPATTEAPDHISVETGFVGYLRLKEAYARECGDIGHAEITAEATANFVAGHLARMAAPLAATLADSGVDFLVLASQVLLKRVGPAILPRICGALPT